MGATTKVCYPKNNAQAIRVLVTPPTKGDEMNEETLDKTPFMREGHPRPPCSNCGKTICDCLAQYKPKEPKEYCECKAPTYYVNSEGVYQSFCTKCKLPTSATMMVGLRVPDKAPPDLREKCECISDIGLGNGYGICVKCRKPIRIMSDNKWNVCQHISCKTLTNGEKFCFKHISESQKKETKPVEKCILQDEYGKCTMQCHSSECFGLAKCKYGRTEPISQRKVEEIPLTDSCDTMQIKIKLNEIISVINGGGE